jgi:hypothetical protein
MLFMAVLAMNVSAQSALRRAEQAEKAQKTNADNVTLRSQITVLGTVEGLFVKSNPKKRN